MLVHIEEHRRGTKGIEAILGPPFLLGALVQGVWCVLVYVIRQRYALPVGDTLTHLSVSLKLPRRGPAKPDMVGDNIPRLRAGHQAILFAKPPEKFRLALCHF